MPAPAPGMDLVGGVPPRPFHCNRCCGHPAHVPQPPVRSFYKWMSFNTPLTEGILLPLLQVLLGMNGTQSRPQPVMDGNWSLCMSPLTPVGHCEVCSIPSPRSPSGIEPQVSTGATRSFALSVLASDPPCLPIPLSLPPGSTSQMNHLHPNPHLSSAS